MFVPLRDHLASTVPSEGLEDDQQSETFAIRT